MADRRPVARQAALNMLAEAPTTSRHHRLIRRTRQILFYNAMAMMLRQTSMLIGRAFRAERGLEIDAPGRWHAHDNHHGARGPREYIADMYHFSRA